jgi:crotonobetainyl-CoA:carnitine CoA-transferase CaiB-like acyl-CoA transferase
MMHSAPDAKQDARSVVEHVWRGAGLSADALDHLTLSGSRPALATSFHVAVAAQSAIACAALAGAELGRLRSGVAQGVRVDMAAAEFECTGYFSVDGRVPGAWAPLSGLYPCRDGHVRIHANFDHHRDGALTLLGLEGNPESYQKADVQSALQNWDAEAFETAAADAGLVVAAARTFAEWDAHPQAAALTVMPLLAVTRIDETDPAPLPSISERNRPLTDVRVLDLTRILAGPVCGRTLAAYGADVMLINSPNLPNIESIADTSRGKLSAHLDLDRSPDVERLRQLVSGAHVFVQGYRPGSLDKRGFSPQELALLRPGIVCVSLSAYGHEGPWAARRGFDSLVQTATGLNKAEAAAFGHSEPKPLPVQILDYAAGFLMAFGAQAALIRQTLEGGSWHVRVSLAQAARWLRGLGRLDDNLQRRKVDLEGSLQAYVSKFGLLRAMPHAAMFERTPAIWQRPSVSPGTNPPEWPAN